MFLIVTISCILLVANAVCGYHSYKSHHYGLLTAHILAIVLLSLSLYSQISVDVNVDTSVEVATDVG